MKADHYTGLVMMNELDENIIKTLVDELDVGGLVIIVPQTVYIYIPYDYRRMSMSLKSAIVSRSSCCSVLLTVPFSLSKKTRML